MKQGKSNCIYSILFGIAILLFVSCTPRQTYKVKSFLFDGVPDPYAVENELELDTINQNGTLSNDTLSLTASRNQMNFHAPYQERDCASCHDRNQMGKLRLPLPELCNQCHEDFSDKYKIVHGPVVSGYCTECHNPHQSKIEKLLTRSGQELCFTCHEAVLFKEGTFHEKIKTTDCTQCHNPHGGDNRLMLQSNDCYQCHENFETKFDFLHGPVSSKDCTICHEEHKSKNEYLLVKPGNELCLNCHNSDDIKTNPSHHYTEKINCTTCHNPHGGASRNLLLYESTAR